MDEYEETNATIQTRHPKLFRDDNYKFEASEDLLMCMPFDFIDGLKGKKWTCIDQKCLTKLMRHLKKAQSSNIKQIRFIRHIGSNNPIVHGMVLIGVEVSTNLSYYLCTIVTPPHNP
jgi:hypothetical protein